MIGPTSSRASNEESDPALSRSRDGETHSTFSVTATDTALIMASTRVISIDYSDSAVPRVSSLRKGPDQETAAPSQRTSDRAAATALLDPTALSNGDGVLVGSHALSTGQAITLGDGASRTTLSLQTQASGETLLASGTSDLISLDATGVSVSAPISSLYHLPDGGYRIGSATMAPGSIVTATEEGDTVTYSMFTRGSTTLFAMGTTSTIAMAVESSAASSADGADLAFTQASDGNFVLDGTTLAPGRPITVGSGPDRTTLAITTFQSVPAIVIDGSLTERLTHPRVSSSSTPALPKIAHAPSSATFAPSRVLAEPSTSLTSAVSAATRTAKKRYLGWLPFVALAVVVAS